MGPPVTLLKRSLHFTQLVAVRLIYQDHLDLTVEPRNAQHALNFEVLYYRNGFCLIFPGLFGKHREDIQPDGINSRGFSKIEPEQGPTGILIRLAFKKAYDLCFGKGRVGVEEIAKYR
jgi:hypothetical protein